MNTETVRNDAIKRLLPRSLFGRALLIIVIPVVLVQVVAGAVFYDRHLQNVAQRLASSVAGDLMFLISTLEASESEKERVRLIETANRRMNMNVVVLSGKKVPEASRPRGETPIEELLFVSLEQGLDRPFSLERRADIKAYYFQIALEDGVLSALVPFHRFRIATAHILLMWTVGASVLLVGVAILFLRNQVRPIRRLAQAAERFGRGEDDPDFKPAGASEVRQASHAFIRMRERILRQIRQRTEMLAGVSHDLRTPLTRMKLELAMLGDSPDVRDLKADVEEMEGMIDSYLAFARGAQGEDRVTTDVGLLLAEVVSAARRKGADVKLSTDGDLRACLRQQGLKRCMTNLIDNAARYASRAEVSAVSRNGEIVVTVDDDGPGIPIEQRAEVLQPFVRLDASRNEHTGGMGLGLAIARDTVSSDGGDLRLEDGPLGGLRASVRLPIEGGNE